MSVRFYSPILKMLIVVVRHAKELSRVCTAMRAFAGTGEIIEKVTTLARALGERVCGVAPFKVRFRTTIVADWASTNPRL